MDKTNRSNAKDMVNKKFGRLTVMERGPNKVRKCKQVFATWVCHCDCGNTVTVAGYRLRKSCGCLALETRTKHGKSNTKLYDTWISMKGRCSNSHNPVFQHYGGRGITVCDEWFCENGFANFYNWAISNGYQDGLTIDRIDVNGNYCPENCRWVSMKIQANNTRRNNYITCKGETHTLKEWEEITGIATHVIRNRIYDLGWDVDRALTEKIHLQYSHKKEAIS